MNQLKLRNYQSSINKAAAEQIIARKNVLIQKPTGAGKTIVAVDLIINLAKVGIAVWFVCHRKELVEQTSKTLTKFGIVHGIIASGQPENLNRLVQVCSVDTLRNRLYEPSSNRPAGKLQHVMMWDECHHIAAASWQKVYDHYSEARHIGLSATPNRHDGKGLEDFFDEIITLDSIVGGNAVRYLMEHGHLANYKLYSIPGVNMKGVKTVAGDYSKKDTFKEMGKKEIVGNCIETWKKICPGVKSIGFGVSIEHASYMSQAFNDAGIPSAVLSSKSPKDQRNLILRQFAMGLYTVLWNCDLFSEGFDIAANSGMEVVVRCVIDSAPTKALPKFLQRCGRALRPSEGAFIIDSAGNAFRDGHVVHGMPCDDRTWSLEGKSGETVVQLKQCEECFFMHKPAPRCPDCGYIYPKKEGNKREVFERDDRELEEMTPERIEERRKAQERQRKIQIAKCSNPKMLRTLGITIKKMALGILATNKKRNSLMLELNNLYSASAAMGVKIARVEEVDLLAMTVAEVQGVIESTKRTIL